MRPSWAKMPATRAAGGFHPGALLLKLVSTEEFFLHTADYMKRVNYTLLTQVLGDFSEDEISEPQPEAWQELQLKRQQDLNRRQADALRMGW